MQNSKVLSLAIDLGAKYTGVFSWFYNSQDTLENILQNTDKDTKQGSVYELDKDQYTLLMQKRTSIRHRRRNLDRAKLVKRLFRLIWIKYYAFEWDLSIQ